MGALLSCLWLSCFKPRFGQGFWAVPFLKQNLSMRFVWATSGSRPVFLDFKLWGWNLAGTRPLKKENGPNQDPPERQVPCSWGKS